LPVSAKKCKIICNNLQKREAFDLCDLEMVLPNDNVNDPAKMDEDLDAAFSAFEKAAAIYLEAIELGRGHEILRENTDLPPAFWHHLRLFGEGKITKDKFLRWIIRWNVRTFPPRRNN
jgi:hypothetical protein